MAKISFGKTVKYNGSIHLPNTIFKVSDSDVADLVKAGGWIKEEPKQEVAEPEKTEIDILREEAGRLGIEYESNWGIKRLTRLIAEAKAQ